ncbi:MAG: redoxin domain-containing protein [Akkermansiaceae bacterium]|nr:redoxin domain-containing protein [Armatimonadota bacterium]
MQRAAGWTWFLSVGVSGLAAVTAMASLAQPAKQTVGKTEPVTARAEAEDMLRTAPRPLPPALSGVGRRVTDACVTDLAGKPHTLSEFGGPKGLVVALVSSSCPVAKKIAPALGRLEADARANGFGVLYLASLATDTPAELKAAAKSAGWKATVVRDTKGTAVAALGATSTTEVFVFDAARTLAYRGAVSDQYGPTWAKDAPTTNYLADALGAVAAGTLPAIPATTAPGCLLTPSKATPAPASSVTYHNRISRIVQANCGDCHRTGGVAPFPLETYAQVIAHSAMIRTVVDAGQMPPWFAAPTKGDEGNTATHTPYANDRRMAADDKRDLLAFLAGPKPVGNPKDAPLPRTFDPEWTAGKPDAVFAFPRAYSVKAEGVLPYQNILVETNLPEDKWVRAIEVKPGAKGVVHHVLVFVQEPGKPQSRTDDRAGFFGAYVPGTAALVYPDGYAKKLPKGAVLRFQMHYTPNGTAQDDRTQIAFQWAKSAPEHEVKSVGVSSLRLNIPPGAQNHKEEAQLPVPADVKILAFMPHMHVRATACRYDLITPDGSRETLLDVPRYDFNWQLTYRRATPLPVSKGSRIEFTGWYDNSAKNPYNPDPTKTVHFGPQTYDEMLLGYIEYVAEDDTTLGRGSRLQGGLAVELIFRRLDRNDDGKVTREEAGNNWSRIQSADTNDDGGITMDEAKAKFGSQ